MVNICFIWRDKVFRLVQVWRHQYLKHDNDLSPREHIKSSMTYKILNSFNYVVANTCKCRLFSENEQSLSWVKRDYIYVQNAWIIALLFVVL